MKSTSGSKCNFYVKRFNKHHSSNIAIDEIGMRRYSFVHYNKTSGGVKCKGFARRQAGWKSVRWSPAGVRRRICRAPYIARAPRPARTPLCAAAPATRVCCDL